MELNISSYREDKEWKNRQGKARPSAPSLCRASPSLLNPCRALPSPLNPCRVCPSRLNPYSACPSPLNPCRACPRLWTPAECFLVIWTPAECVPVREPLISVFQSAEPLQSNQSAEPLERVSQSAEPMQSESQPTVNPLPKLAMFKLLFCSSTVKMILNLQTRLRSRSWTTNYKTTWNHEKAWCWIESFIS